jgi:hypothetical protein
MKQQDKSIKPFFINKLKNYIDKQKIFIKKNKKEFIILLKKMKKPYIIRFIYLNEHFYNVCLTSGKIIILL